MMDQVENGPQMSSRPPVSPELRVPHRWTVDAICYGFRPIVVRDCVGDRATGPHEANLFDLQQKYADVVSLDEALNHLVPKYSNAG